MRRRGLPVVDNPFLDSFSLPTVDKAAHYTRLLRDLPPGLSEWAVHPGLGDPESRSIEPDGFLISSTARDLLREEGIAVIDYRSLREAWPHR
jgi:hypothetical protein